MKKRNIKVIAGWILIAIQGLAIAGNMMSGNSMPNGIPGFIGFFLFGIIGVILLVLGYKDKQN